ncbi:MAG: fused MFS/spermidine synthase [Candidatus Acidiferrales bacterium]
MLCFFLSGAAGLVYQVAWGKALGLVFGNTVYAIATVLAVFMGGLATGSALLGRWSECHANPVALYGWVELGVAASGVLSLAGLAGVRLLYVGSYPLVEGWMPALIALRFIGAALVLFVPTFLMGGTLPIMVRGLTRNSAELGARISRLYWVNTLGAVTGTLAAGLWLLPELGLRQTVLLAATLNVIAGAIALAASRFWLIAPSPALDPSDEVADPTIAAATGPAAVATPSAVASQLSPRWLLAAFAAVGATAFVYEVAWVRLLATHLGSSTYAFTVMLVVFLTGIALGTIAFELWLKLGRPVTLGTFAATQTLTAASALVFLYFYNRFPELLPRVLRLGGANFENLLLAQFEVSAAAILPAALVFGFNFPVVMLLIAGRPEASGRHGAAVGHAYAANTIGAIVGAVAAGFWLVPAVGSYRLVAFTAIANLVLAGALALQHSRRATLALATQGLLLGGCILAASGAFYDRALATFGTMVYWDYHDEKLTLAEMAATTDVVFAKDGLNATISVTRAEDYVALRINGKVDASPRDAVTQLLVGHLGAVFHHAPKRVLVIGFGSGMTVSAVSRHPEVERIVCVEIEPAVIEASQYLGRLHRGVVDDPRLEIVLDDARNYLLTTREQFDLIVSEPSNPWIAGVSALFTDEFYREAKRRLEPGGLFVQWVQAYSLFPADFRMILATLAPHFPQVSLWRAASSDYLLLAQLEAKPLELDRLRMLWRYEGLRADFEELGMRRPEGILGFHRLDDPDVRRFIAGASRNTDDRTQLEYNAPRALLDPALESENAELIWQHRAQLIPSVVQADDLNLGMLGAAETMLNNEDTDAAERFLRALAAAPSTVELEVVRGRVALERNRYADARSAFRAALALDPASLEAVQALGELARKQIDLDTAALLFRQILARDPNYRPALEGMRNLERSRANWAGALPWQQRLTEMDPTEDELSALGEVLMRTGDLTGAEEYFTRALATDAYSYSAHRNLGEIFRQVGQFDRALPHLQHVVRLDPDTEAGVYISIADVYRRLGRPRDARDAIAKGRRLFPADTHLGEAAKEVN